MKQIVIGLVIGLIIGSAAMLAITKGPPVDQAVSHQSISVPVAAPAQVRIERTEATTVRFSDIQTIEDVLNLTSEFDESEALYALAGRADAAGIKELIKQALRISDATDRRGAMYVLFSRLSDIDPYLAVEMAADSSYNIDSWFEESIWRSWARRDLEEALTAANQLTSLERKGRAAQAMYFALGIANSAETDRIKAVLNIEPTQWALYRYAESLTLQSSQQAISYLNSVGSINTQVYIAGRLGTHLANVAPNRVIGLAELITAALPRKQYLRNANNQLIAADPMLAFSQNIQSASSQEDWRQVSLALANMAASDFESAVQLWSDVSDKNQRSRLAHILIKTLAKQEPRSALEWALNMETEGEMGLVAAAVRELSSSNPREALMLLNAFNLGDQHDVYRGTVIAALALTDTSMAMAEIANIGDLNIKQTTLEQVIQVLGRSDGDAALALLLDNQALISEERLTNLLYSLHDVSSETAAKTLLELGGDAPYALTQRLTQSVLRGLSSSEMDAVVQRFKYSDKYSEVLKAASEQLAYQDPDAALGYARLMPAGPEKNNVLTNIMSRLVESNPAKALQLMDELPAEKDRLRAALQLIPTWARTDAGAAQEWAIRLPSGKMRDRALGSILMQKMTAGEEDVKLLNQIENTRVRSSALRMVIHNIASRNPQKATEVLAGVELPEFRREDLQNQIDDCYGASTEEQSVECLFF